MTAQSMFNEILAAFHSFVRPDMTQEEIATALDARAGKESWAWRVSTTDLLKTLELDSSLEARSRLAAELGYWIEFTGTPKDNLWLHSQVLVEVAKHGIRIPTGRL